MASKDPVVQLWKRHTSFVMLMKPPRLQHAKCRISITQQRPNCAFNCSETREIKAKTSKRWQKHSEKAVWFQGGVWGLDQHHYHHHHQRSSCRPSSGSSVPVMLHLPWINRLNWLWWLSKHVSYSLVQILVRFCKKIFISYQVKTPKNEIYHP